MDHPQQPGLKLADVVQDWVKAKRHAKEKEKEHESHNEKQKEYIRTVLNLDDNKKTYVQSDDNVQRDIRCQNFLKEFYSLDQVKQAVVDVNDCNGLQPHTALSGHSDKIVAYFEHALSLNNIKLNIIVATIGDSAIVVDPIKDKKFLRVPFAVLAPEICKIPFTLYKKLGIRILSIC
mmetsp:Transcript_26456/g.23412  ORF Transcript_26456/g.23412 Transcript_26456/m.23412 type:complete len:177 (+) Transcript_26456:77-607(+)